MKNVFVMCPNPTDATSLYRGLGPLQALRRKMGGDINLIVAPEVNWATLKGSDAIFLQRPALDHHLTIVNMALASRKPVWVDFDDDLFRIPRCNPAARIYAKLQNNMVAIVAKATVVTVSTEALAETLRAILKRVADGKQTEAGISTDQSKIVVVPNALDDELLDLPTDYPCPGSLVTWRGSATHDKDLALVTEQLARVIGRNLEWTYQFVGEPFWWTMERLDEVPGLKPKSITQVEPLDPIVYFDFLKKVKPAVFIVPLQDIPFNRAKSNIAWIEATYAGAVTIAPDWPEWQKPGVIRYKDAADFEKVFGAALQGGTFDLADRWHKSRDYIEENLRLTTVNRVREVVLRGMIDR